MSTSFSPGPIDLRYEGSITSSSQPKLAFEQARAMIGNFGLTSTIQALRYKRTGESDDVAFEVNASELRHPLSIRKTHSDLCSIVDVFCRRIYDIPGGLAEKVGSSAIVDIGAYNGTTPAFFASHYPDSQVLAIEPNNRNYPLLRENASPYGDQINPIHAAATPAHGSVIMDVLGFATDSMQNAFVLDPDQGLATNATGNNAVGAITPDEILAHLDYPRIGILKVDIEGAEKPLFESPAIDELLRQTGILLVETHDQLVPGSSRAVHDATIRNGLVLSPFNQHTDMYYRPWCPRQS